MSSLLAAVVSLSAAGAQLEPVAYVLDITQKETENSQEHLSHSLTTPISAVDLGFEEQIGVGTGNFDAYT